MELITIFGFLGVIATLYAIHVEEEANKSEKDAKDGNGKGLHKKYVAFCDIHDGMSCSRVLTSEYAKMGRVLFGLKPDNPFNLPNTYYGMMFYIGVILYEMYPFTLIPFRETFLFFAAIGSVLSSVILAYILTFKLKDVCLVCMTTYVINALIMWQAWNEFFH